MLTIQQYVDSFLANIKEGSEKLKNYTMEVNDRQKEIKNQLKLLDDFMKSMSSKAVNMEEDELKKMMMETIELYQQKIKKWIDRVDNYIAGKEFIHQFEKSILLAVFGNVNSGKSSLGNFIAGIPFEQSKVSYTTRPQFYVYDWSTQAKERGAVPLQTNEFKENDVEETSTIQYYTLNDGLTWVDTPGIHSLNKENEELAKKYVDYADLILFVVSSSSPGQADEIVELERLMRKEKPVLVVITKSDKTIKDEIDGQLVTILMPKDEETRKTQERYVQEVISKKGITSYLKNQTYLSVSVRVAKKAIIENDNELFVKSNMPKLYEQIGRTISDRGLELKIERPRKEVNSTIKEIQEGFSVGDNYSIGLFEMMETIKQLVAKIDSKKQELHSLRKRILPQLKVEITPIIETSLMKLSLKHDAGEKIDSEQIAQKLLYDIQPQFNKVLSQNVTEIIKDYQHIQLQALSLDINVKFEDKYETIKYQEYDIVKRQRDPQGILEHIQHFFGKKFEEIAHVKREKEKKIRLGNNVVDVTEKVLDQVYKQLDLLVEEAIDVIANSYFNAVEQTLNEIIKKMEEVNSRLEQLKF